MIVAVDVVVAILNKKINIKFPYTPPYISVIYTVD